MVALDAGMTAPDFNLEGINHKNYSLKELVSGKGAILAFFKTGCPTCQLAFPFIERLYQRVRNTPVQFLAIDQHDPEDLDDFIQRYKLTMPVAMENEPYPVSSAYEITNVPTLFLIDENRKIVKNLVGHSKEGLETILQLTTKLAESPALEPVFTAADAHIKAFQPG